MDSITQSAFHPCDAEEVDPGRQLHDIDVVLSAIQEAKRTCEIDEKEQIMALGIFPKVGMYCFAVIGYDLTLLLLLRFLGLPDVLPIQQA